MSHDVDVVDVGGGSAESDALDLIRAFSATASNDIQQQKILYI